MEQELITLMIDSLFLDLQPADISPAAPLSDYEVDSFRILELIVAIEAQFSVKFDQADINADTLKSIDSLCACIRAKQAG
jgi:acyl carrier protein